jgi:hypothetical protein
MNCRRADSGSPFPRDTAQAARECEPEFLSHARLRCNLCAENKQKNPWNSAQSQAFEATILAKIFC